MDITAVVMKSLNYIGIDIDYDGEADIDLLNWLQDSLLYISFIVELENNLDIELPYEMLVIDSLSSFKGFCEMIVKLKSHLQ
jgi:acyl carrier protein